MVSDCGLAERRHRHHRQQVGRDVADRRRDHERPGPLRGCVGLRWWSARAAARAAWRRAPRPPRAAASSPQAWQDAHEAARAVGLRVHRSSSTPLPDDSGSKADIAAASTRISNANDHSARPGTIVAMPISFVIATDDPDQEHLDHAPGLAMRSRRKASGQLPRACDPSAAAPARRAAVASCAAGATSIVSADERRDLRLAAVVQIDDPGHHVGLRDAPLHVEREEREAVRDQEQRRLQRTPTRAFARGRCGDSSAAAHRSAGTAHSRPRARRRVPGADRSHDSRRVGWGRSPVRL